MVQGQSKDSHAALLQRWIDVLHRWEEKKSQYQIELDQATDLDQKQELAQGIEACETVIQTSQGLIQALSDRNLAVSTSFPAPEMLTLDASATGAQTPSTTATTQQEPSSSQVAPSAAITLLPASDLSTAQTPSPAFSAPPSDLQSPTMKGLLKIGLPLIIIAAVGLVTFRPKNACKLAPDGSYSDTGLAKRVQQVLSTSDYAAEFKTVSVGQYGCTIVLKGRVSSQAVQRKMVDLAQSITLPSQSPIEQAKRALGQESDQVQPVEGVDSQLLTVKTSPKR
jgi:hypothetical protein